MINVSISQLKTNPSGIINQAVEYPVAIQSRNDTKAYLVGKDIYNKLLSIIEDLTDQAAVDNADFSKGKDFEDLAKELGI